jgi:hypothetical protein
VVNPQFDSSGVIAVVTGGTPPGEGEVQPATSRDIASIIKIAEKTRVECFIKSHLVLRQFPMIIVMGMADCANTRIHNEEGNWSMTGRREEAGDFLIF